MTGDENHMSFNIKDLVENVIQNPELSVAFKDLKLDIIRANAAEIVARVDEYKSESKCNDDTEIMEKKEETEKKTRQLDPEKEVTKTLCPLCDEFHTNPYLHVIKCVKDQTDDDLIKEAINKLFPLTHEKGALTELYSKIKELLKENKFKIKRKIKMNSSRRNIGNALKTDADDFYNMMSPEVKAVIKMSEKPKDVEIDDEDDEDDD
jgi:hypothetical protein